jgi:hypothetical protein
MTIDSQETTMTQTIEHDPAPQPPFLGDDVEPDGDALPRRPRRRLLTPVTGGLAAIIVAAAGFAGGVQLEKAQASTGTTAAAPAGPAAGGPRAGFGGFGGAAGAGAGGGAASGSAVTGTVSYEKGNTLYVKGADGTTVKVTVANGAKVTRTASTDASNVHPGDTVVVQGSKGKSGTVTASTVTATASASGT